MATKGPTFFKIQRYLKHHYSPPKFSKDVATAFGQWFEEEEFNDDDLAEELLETNDDIENSFFYLFLTDNKDKKFNFSKNNAIQLFKELQKAMKTESAYTAFYDLNINVTKNEMDEIVKEMKTQCADLIPNDAIDFCLYSILAIGAKNDIPLLTYLVDAYNRYRIKKYKKKAEKNKKPKEISEAEFVAKCSGFKSFNASAKQRKKFEDLCQMAIASFMKRLLAKVRMHSFTMIDDNIIEISKYILQSYSLINSYIKQQNNPLPIQIDLWIVPKSIKTREYDVLAPNDEKDMNDDNEDYEDSEDEYNEPPNEEYEQKKNNASQAVIGDISDRLQKMKSIFKDNCTTDHFPRDLTQGINDLVGDQRCQRVCAIIDRRNNNKEEKKNSDSLYMYRPPNDSSDFESNPTKLIPESLFQNSRKCLLPATKQNNKVIGCNTDLEGKMFCLSFHILSANEIRIYLFHNGWGTRFFIQDLLFFLPQFFDKKQAEKLQKILKKNDDEFTKKYQECCNLLKDERFEHFYKTMIGDNKDNNPY